MQQFGALNSLILLLYLGAMLAVGFIISRRQKSGDDYFLAGRRLPWWAVGMSMYASLTSAMTYIGLPNLAFKSNVTFLAAALASPLVAPIILILFYSWYQRLGVSTAYEYLEYRFGRAGRLSAASLFILSRLGWLGTVIYAPSLAFSVASGIDVAWCIVMMAVLATLYTAMGGLSAVVWTDVIQFVILIGGAVWIAVSLSSSIPGGVTGILTYAADNDHLGLADWHFNWFEMTMPIVLIHFFFQMMQEYGCDQVTVQRLMATGSYRGMVKAVSMNALVDMFIITTLLFIGLGLFAYYGGPGEHVLPAEVQTQKVLPYYIMNALPAGISGLLITAIFAAAMSSMDSGLNSISSVIIKDFMEPFGAKLNDAHTLRLGRALTVVLGVVAMLSAFWSNSIGGIVKAFMTYMSLFSAPVLALFLLGALTRRGHFWGWLLSAVITIGVMLILQKMTFDGQSINEMYFFPLSLGICFSLSLVLSWIFPSGSSNAELCLFGRVSRSSDV